MVIGKVSSLPPILTRVQTLERLLGRGEGFNLLGRITALELMLGL
jgi:hypothetical protein